MRTEKGPWVRVLCALGLGCSVLVGPGVAGSASAHEEGPEGEAELRLEQLVDNQIHMREQLGFETDRRFVQQTIAASIVGSRSGLGFVGTEAEAAELSRRLTVQGLLRQPNGSCERMSAIDSVTST
jgi:hypothetical protein